MRFLRTAFAVALLLGCGPTTPTPDPATPPTPTPTAPAPTPMAQSVPTPTPPPAALSQEDKINHLLDFAAASKVVFIRNGSRYDGKQAADHLRSKRESVGTRVKTARDFIVGCATKSLMSGSPYVIVDEEGRERPCAEWLTEELQRFEAEGR